MLLTAALFFAAAIARINAETSFSHSATTTSSSSISTSSTLSTSRSSSSSSTSSISTSSTSSTSRSSSSSSTSLTSSSSSSTSILSDTTSTSSASSDSSAVPSPDLIPTTTSGLSAELVTSNAGSVASSDLFPTITGAPYYNPADFVNPYFYRVLASTEDDIRSHLYSCSSIWNSSFQQWLLTGKITTGSSVTAITVTTTKVPWVSMQQLTTETIHQLFPASTYVTTIQSGVTIPPEIVTLTSSAYGPLYYVDHHLDFTASEPCCEQCTIYGGSVQVYFWPPATETPAVSTQLFNRTQAPTLSTLVDAAGFTFTSPSTYVAFESLYAANLCGDVGPRYAATTLAFSPGELSTSLGYHVKPSGASETLPWLVPLNNPEIKWTRATFGDQPHCGHKVDVFWGLGGMAFIDRGDALSAASSLLSEFPMPGTKVIDLLTAFSFTYDPCSPTLSIPSQILTMASEWSVCAPPVTAFFDPPYTLTKGGQLSAFDPVTMPPAPVPTAVPNLASSTKTTSPIHAVVTPSPSDPAPPPAPTTSPTDPPSPGVNNPPATTPGANDPGTSNQPNPAQDPAGQGPANTNSPRPAAVITFGPSSITADQSSKFIIASQTLTRGGEITVSGTHVSLASDGGFVVIDGSVTQAVATQIPSQTSPPEYSVITISGTVISILPGATNALVGGKTVVLSELGVTTSSDGNIGWNIVTIGGFGPGEPTPTGNSGYNGPLYTGGAARNSNGRGVWGLAILLGVGLLGVCWL